MDNSAKIVVRGPMRQAIVAVPFGASFKAGLQSKRRFWEEDEAITARLR